MKAIKKIHIENIGQYKNVDINFKEGLNIIFAKNGTGKTTLTRAVTKNEDEDNVKLFYSKKSKAKLAFFNKKQVSFYMKKSKESYGSWKTPNFKIRTISEKYFNMLRVQNEKTGQITTLDNDKYLLEILMDEKHRYEEIEREIWDIYKNSKDSKDNLLSQYPFSSFNKIKNLKDFKKTIEKIKEARVLLRILLFLSKKLKMKKQELINSFLRIRTGISLAFDPFNTHNDGIFDPLSDIRNKVLEIIDQSIKSGVLITDSDKEFYNGIVIDPNLFSQSSYFSYGFTTKKEILERIKKINDRKSKSQIENKEFSKYLSEKLAYHSLSTKIKITNDLTIKTKKGKKGIVLSTAEIRIISLLKYVYDSRNDNIIWMDDPISTMDYENIYFVRDLILEIAQQKQVIVLTHDLSVAEKLTQYTQGVITLNKITLSLMGGFVKVDPKPTFTYPLIQLVNELKNARSEFIIPSLSRQILELLSTTFNPNGIIKDLFDAKGENLIFLGIKQKLKFKVNAFFIHDLTHLKTVASKKRWANREHLFAFKTDMENFIEKILKNEA